jgi:hypothetical protein
VRRQLCMVSTWRRVLCLDADDVGPDAVSEGLEDGRAAKWQGLPATDTRAAAVDLESHSRASIDMDVHNISINCSRVDAAVR